MQLTHTLLALSLSTITVTAFKCETIPADQHPRVFVEPSCCYELKGHLGGGWGEFLGEACLDATVRKDGKGFECIGFDGGEGKELILKEKSKKEMPRRRPKGKGKGRGKGRVKAMKGGDGEGDGDGDGDDDGMVLTVVESCCYFAEGGWKLGCEDPEDDNDDEGGHHGKDGKDEDDGKKDGEKEVVIRIEV